MGKNTGDFEVVDVVMVMVGLYTGIAVDIVPAAHAETDLVMHFGVVTTMAICIKAGLEHKPEVVVDKVVAVAVAAVAEPTERHSCC